MIAQDQGLTLPPKAKLWLWGDNNFYILNQSNGFVAAVDTNLLSVTVFDDIYRIKTSYVPHYKSEINGTKLLTLHYNGASTSFTVNLYGQYYFYNEAIGTNAVLVRTYSGVGFGPGASDGQPLIVTGTFNADYKTQYVLGGSTGLFPVESSPPSNPLGTFPGNTTE